MDKYNKCVRMRKRFWSSPIVIAAVVVSVVVIDVVGGGAGCSVQFNRVHVTLRLQDPNWPDHNQRETLDASAEIDSLSTRFVLRKKGTGQADWLEKVGM